MTRHGITVKRSMQFKDAAGNVQQAFDTLTTNSVNTETQASGTITFDRAADSLSGDDRGGNRGPGGGHGEWGRGRGEGGELLGDSSSVLTATTTINSSSSRTVSGLAQGSTQRTVDGASAGTESTAGTSSRGSFTASRAVGDTTTGLVIPVASSSTAPAYPTAGTTIRSIQASLQLATLQRDRGLVRELERRLDAANRRPRRRVGRASCCSRRPGSRVRSSCRRPRAKR